jgi:hypothetical protein
MEKELSQEYYKEEIKQCELCSGWIESKVHRLFRYNRCYYFHPFCYTRATLYKSLPIKNARYKSVNSNSLILKL